jgi:NitT/TauT family transport system substrate-binding protein
MRVQRVLIAIVTVAMLVVAGCGDDGGSAGGGSKEGGVTKVKVGVLPISNVAPLYLGMKKGFFKAEGLEVEPAIGQSGNELVTGMVSGSTDFAFLGYVPLMSARSQGLPVKVVANADNGAETEDKEWTLILTKKGSPIKRPADLADKTIAVNALKGVGEVAIKAALEKRGVDPGSVKLLEVPFPEMPAALSKGRVDAIWAPEPFLTSVLGEGGQDVEAPLTTLGKKFPNGNYATTEKEIAQNKDVVEAFARAINKSSEYATAHPDEARATIPTFTKIPPDVAKKIRLPLWPPEIDREQLQTLLDYAVKYKVIEKAPSLDDVIWEGASK